MLYCPGSGQELLSALGVIVVCQDSKNFLMRELPLSMIDASVKINDMVMRPSMISNSGAFGRCFYIPYVFFFPRSE